jgi:hypothetical protein
VRWHYQWITAHDFLRHVVGEDMASSALEPGATWQPGARRFFRGENGPYIPVEFSAAAYRFGHSMVRDSYDVNSQTLGVPILPAGDGQHLGGFRRLPASLKIDWAFFFETRDGQVPQPSRLIDTNIAGPLFTLPVRVAPRPRLAWLNLQRGAALGLPTGIDVAQAMGAPLLSESELHLDDVAPAARPALLRAPPLWYYILCEARALSKGEYLGPVGGGIVAEVLLGLLEADPHSYLCGTPAWTPELPGTGGDFTMADLVRFAEPPGPA